MNRKMKASYYSFDDVVIFACKGIACIAIGIAGVCAMTILYGFIKNILIPAIVSI